MANETSEIQTDQARMNAELYTEQSICPLPFYINTQRIFIPQIKGFRETVYNLPQSPHKEYGYLFSAIAFWIYSVLRGSSDIAVSHRKSIHQLRIFFDFLNRHDLSASNRFNVLNDFTAYLTEQGLRADDPRNDLVRKSLRYAIRSREYTDKTNKDCLQYLLEAISACKRLPRTPPNPTTLGNWFAQHTWLRQRDVGVGHKTYTLLASPKALSASLRVFSETYLIELTNWKLAFIDFVENSGITLEDIPSDDLHWGYRADSLRPFLPFLDDLSTRLKCYSNQSIYLTNFIWLICNSWLNCEKAVHQFKNQQPLSSTRFLRRTAGPTNPHNILFSLSYLRSLVAYATSPNKAELAIPCSQAEHLLFRWLMAGMTVQESDIPKLSRNNFTFCRNMGGAITSFQLTYYKGRSGFEQTLKLVPASTNLFRAISGYVLNRSGSDALHKSPLCPVHGDNPTPKRLSAFFEVAEKRLNAELEMAFAMQDTSPVFFKVMLALTKNGRPKPSGPCKKGSNDVRLLAGHIFSCSMVKTYAVYAASDTFDAARLVNWHSHNNATEKNHYLTAANLEWQDNSGRITRAVIQDLTSHLCNASTAERRAFNEDLSGAMGEISRRAESTLERLQIITGRQNGSINELGILSKQKDSQGVTGLGAPIYLLDSPGTIVKLQHYLSELSEKSAMLASNNPDFLFYTALPTAEWIENILKKNNFSHFDEGMALYKKHAQQLPRLFLPEIGQ